MYSVAEVLDLSGSFAALGIAGHVYIILCLMLPSKGSRSERVTRAINFTIGISSFMHSLSCCLTIVWTFLGLDTGYDPFPYVTITYCLSCILFSEISVTSFLFILYWSRIVPLRSAVLIRLLEVFSKGIHWVIAGSVLACCLLSTFVFKMDVRLKNSSDIVVNKIVCKELNAADFVLLSAVALLLIFLPLSLMTFSSLSVLLHLIGHMRRLSSEACEISSPQTVQQKRAVIMLFVQLVLYTCYLCALFTLLIVETNNWVTDLNMWGMAVPSIYSFCVAANLISWNGFLRKKTVALLSRLQRSGGNLK